MTEEQLFDAIMLSVVEFIETTSVPNPYVVLGVLEHVKLHFAQSADKAFEAISTHESP
jgi:hypothetical protein